MSFVLATSLEEALAALEAGARPIAGGTDLVVGARQGKSALPDDIVAIDRIEALAAIDVGDSETRIGSSVTHARLMADPIIVDNFTSVADAAALVGSPSTRNVGTIGGNVMNSSPAMDTGAPLLVLGAVAELTSTTGSRRVALAELWTGPGTHSAAANELCTAIIVPNVSTDHGSAYVRLEYRRAMEIAVVGAAASVTLDGANIRSIRVALTAVAPTILEVDGLDGLAGRPVDDALLAEVAAAASSQATPISDLRASDAYRSHTIGVMTRRAVDAAARRASGEHISVPVNRALGIGAAS